MHMSRPLAFCVCRGHVSFRGRLVAEGVVAKRTSLLHIPCFNFWLAVVLRRTFEYLVRSAKRRAQPLHALATRVPTKRHAITIGVAKSITASPSGWHFSFRLTTHISPACPAALQGADARKVTTPHNIATIIVKSKRARRSVIQRTKGRRVRARMCKLSASTP